MNGLNMAMQPPRRPKAFISCSLREEDRQFVDYIEWIVMMCGFEPFGTTGRYSTAPIPIYQHMDDSIKQADCLVLVATPRYKSQDIHNTQEISKCISEMLHVESGMAVAYKKPVIVFVKEGTDVGSFLPQITQYITLRYNDRQELVEKRYLIEDYFNRAYNLINENIRKQDNAALGNTVLKTLAAFGGFSLLKSLFIEDADEYE